MGLDEVVIQEYDGAPSIWNLDSGGFSSNRRKMRNKIFQEGSTFGVKGHGEKREATRRHRGCTRVNKYQECRA
jgi:hypothetical protein